LNFVQKTAEPVDFSKECKEISTKIFEERSEFSMQDYPIIPFDWSKCLQCERDFTECSTANLIRGLDACRHASNK
jgi:hypothetical protein